MKQAAVSQAVGQFRQAILETLRQTSGNQTKAAKVLGISDRTLREKVRRYRERECLQPVS